MYNKHEPKWVKKSKVDFYNNKSVKNQSVLFSETKEIKQPANKKTFSSMSVSLAGVSVDCGYNSIDNRGFYTDFQPKKVKTLWGISDSISDENILIIIDTLVEDDVVEFESNGDIYRGNLKNVMTDKTYERYQAILTIRNRKETIDEILESL